MEVTKWVLLIYLGFIFRLLGVEVARGRLLSIILIVQGWIMMICGLILLVAHFWES